MLPSNTTVPDTSNGSRGKTADMVMTYAFRVRDARVSGSLRARVKVFVFIASAPSIGRDLALPAC